jgi:phosphoenolpyruvate-protein kinase (PTS system EI component)
VCGEAAADATMIPLLVGIGVDELSVASGSIGPVRQQVSILDPEACAELARRAVAARTVSEVRALVER